jgi:hypothetical protein
MARKPNYQFERLERDRLKANKVAQKANAKREQREAQRAADGGDQAESSDPADKA